MDEIEELKERIKELEKDLEFSEERIYSIEAQLEESIEEVNELLGELEDLKEQVDTSFMRPLTSLATNLAEQDKLELLEILFHKCSREEIERIVEPYNKP